MRHSSLWRTTPFRLATAFGAAYVLGVALLLGVVYFQTASYLTRRVDRILTAEADLLRRAGPDDILKRLQQEGRRDPLNAFALYAADGQRVAGDAGLRPAELPGDTGVREFLSPRDHASERALAVRLPWGEVLVVARDAGQLIELRQVLAGALVWSGSIIAILGVASGVALSLEPIARIQAMRAASARIIAGDLGARLAVGRRRDELDELAIIVNVMMGEVERLMVHARTAGESIAHELRTPLTRLRATLEHARDSAPTAQPSRKLLEACVAEADGVLARFQVLLRIAAVEAKQRQAEIAVLDLSSLVEQVGEFYAPLARERGLAFHVTVSPGMTARIDNDLVFEAIANLLDNAMKFTPPGGAVGLSLAPAGASWVVEVRDTGPGVAAAERALITKHFYRSPAHHAVAGHGLGLSLVAAVVELHGFRLEFDDAGPGMIARIAAIRSPDHPPPGPMRPAA